MERRRYLRCLSVGGGISVAGCMGSFGSDETETDTPTGTSPPGDGSEETPGDDETDAPDEVGNLEGAVVGQSVQANDLAMVVREFREVESLGEFAKSTESKVFVVVRLAVKNTNESNFVDFSAQSQTRLVDDAGNIYKQETVASTGQMLQSGRLMPGEVARGDVVLKIPRDASGLSLEFDFAKASFETPPQVQVDLSKEASPIEDLSQDLAVPINDVGETAESGDLTVELTGFESTGQLDEASQADEGNEYAIVDVAVTNETGQDQSISTVVRMMLKDGEGFTYTHDSDADSVLEKSFDQDGPISDGQTRRGKLAYQVPEGTSPLYWIYKFSPFVGRDKAFWQVR